MPFKDWFEPPISVLLPNIVGLDSNWRPILRFQPLDTARQACCRPILWFSLAFSIVSGATLADEPYGTWLTVDRDSRIKLTRCGANLCGNVIWLSEPNNDDGSPKRDIYNPDASLRGRPVMGIQILQDLAPDGDHWVGKIYNPENGKTYQATFRMISAKRAELEGCAAVIFCEKQIWTKD
jgi:uncharacterized protein (DUF2147 family)